MARGKKNKGRGKPRKRGENKHTEKDQAAAAIEPGAVHAKDKSPEHQPERNGSTQPATKQQQFEFKRWLIICLGWLRDWRNWRKIFAVSEIVLAAAIAYFAFVQASVNRGQLSEMAKQNEVLLWQAQQTEKTLKLMEDQQQPYIAMALPEMSEFVARKPVDYSFKAVNTGGATGTIVHLNHALIISDAKQDIRADMEKLAGESRVERRFLTIPKDGAIDIRNYATPAFTQEQIERVNSDRGVLRMATFAIYAGNFGEVREIWRCFKYRPALKGFVIDDAYERDKQIGIVVKDFEDLLSSPMRPSLNHDESPPPPTPP